MPDPLVSSCRPQAPALPRQLDVSYHIDAKIAPAPQYRVNTAHMKTIPGPTGTDPPDPL